MGDDDANEGNEPGACLEHRFVLDEVTPGPGSIGLRMLHRCRHCGALAYEASRADERGRGGDAAT